MPSRFNPINEASRAKKKPITDEIWEKHRSDILRRHRDGASVAKVADWINDQGISDFEPSAAQVRMRLKAWKQDGAPQEDPSRLDEQHHLTSESAITVSNNESSSPSSSGKASRRVTQIHSTPWAPPVPHKRPLSGETPTSEESHKRFRSPEDTATPDFSEDLSSYLSEHPQSISSYSTPEFNDFSSSEYNAIFEPEHKRSSIFIPAEGQSQKIILVNHNSGYEQPIDLAKLQYAADFLQASAMRSQASSLYLTLCRVYQRFRPLPRRKCLESLAACVRCAIIAKAASELLECKRILRDWLEMLDNFMFTTFETWFIRVLLLQILQATGDKNGTTDALRDMYANREEPSDFLETLSRVINDKPEMFENFAKHVHVSFLTLQDLAIDVKVVNARFGIYLSSLDQVLFLQLRDMLSHADYIQGVLEWIQSQLNTGFNHSVSWDYFQRQMYSPRDRDAAILFCFLASRWINQYTEIGKPAFRYASLQYDSSGAIPGLEMIRILSQLISNFSPTRNRLSQFGVPRLLIDKWWDLSERAKAGIKRLGSFPAPKLTRAFLECLTSSMWQVKFQTQEDTSSWLGSSISLGFIEHFLELDVNCIIDKHKLFPHEIAIENYNPASESFTKTIQPSRNDGPFVSRPVSMIAESLSSSDLSSMRRMRLRANSFVSTSTWQTPSTIDDLSDSLSLLSTTGRIPRPAPSHDIGQALTTTDD